MVSSFPNKWIVTRDGELVELGDGVNEIWGFTIQGMIDENNPLHQFSRSWRTVNDFLEGKRNIR